MPNLYFITATARHTDDYTLDTLVEAKDPAESFKLLCKYWRKNEIKVEDQFGPDVIDGEPPGTGGLWQDLLLIRLVPSGDFEASTVLGWENIPVVAYAKPR